MGGLTARPEATDSGSPARQIAADWLRSYSAEVTTPDRRSLDEAARLMWPNAPVYIASLPKDTSDKQLEVAIQLNRLGLRPVPHVVARNLTNFAAFERAIEAFATKAGVDRALVLGGDRDQPAGEIHSALQLIDSGAFAQHGIRKIAIACYPEGHPCIEDAVLDAALMQKLESAHGQGLNVRLITQLCFDAEPIVAFVRKLRTRGIDCDLRVGLAGPASTATLVKYAAICGVGPSLRALREKRSLTRGLMQAGTPQEIIADLARAMAIEPSLAITGLHFFTFSSLKKTIDWAEAALATDGLERG